MRPTFKTERPAGCCIYMHVACRLSAAAVWYKARTECKGLCAAGSSVTVVLPNIFRRWLSRSEPQDTVSEEPSSAGMEQQRRVSDEREACMF